MADVRYYRNPVLNCDFSDPDAIRVGGDYYMIASSFTYVPGVPVLHSTDLVNWDRIGYCVRELPFERYQKPAHGCGTWAPALRYHDGIFYAFIPMPDEGIFVTSARNPAGEWEPLRCIKKAVGWIDPCPFWDEDGRVYMVHAFANSRCGIKHKIQMSSLDPVTLEVTEDGPIVFDGFQTQPTAEGPKLYKRNGWYYIFIPAGGVAAGWQTALRSRNIYGPYEEKIVLHQGNSGINGPHQGAWVTDPNGKDWFLHFQDAKTVGRVIHLQPMCWRENWPFIGQEQNGDGIGEPVEEWPCPVQGKKTGETVQSQGKSVRIAPPFSDDFHGGKPGLMWQWQANFRTEWLAAQKQLKEEDGLALSILPTKASLWEQPNVLSQMIPGKTFRAEVTAELRGAKAGSRAGIGILGLSYSFLEVVQTSEGRKLQLGQGEAKSSAPTAAATEEIVGVLEGAPEQVRLAVEVTEGTWGSYFVNGKELSGRFPVSRAVWTGARLGLYARGEEKCGVAVFKEFRME